MFLENWWNWWRTWHAFKFQICSRNCWDVMLWRGNRNGLTFGCVLFLYCQSCFGVACFGVCQSWCLIHQMQLLTNPTYTTWSFKYPRNSTTIEMILVCRVLFHNTGAPILYHPLHAQRNNDNKRAHKPILIGWCSWWYPGSQLHLVLQPMFPTVDGRNSALNIPLFTGFCASQVVKDFFHEQNQMSHTFLLWCFWNSRIHNFNFLRCLSAQNTSHVAFLSPSSNTFTARIHSFSLYLDSTRMPKHKFFPLLGNCSARLSQEKNYEFQTPFEKGCQLQPL